MSSFHRFSSFVFLSLLLLSSYCDFVCAGVKTPPVDIDGKPIKQFAFTRIQYVSITKINGVEQSFQSDFYMYTTWAAPKHDPAVTTDDDLNDLSDHYWQPQLDFINAIGGITPLITGALTFIPDDEIGFDPSIYNFTLPDGYIWCGEDQRYVGEFLTPVEMKSFPYDQQRALLIVESYWGADVVKIVFAQPDRITIDYMFPPTMPEILGWRTIGAEWTNEDIHYAYNDVWYNRLTLAIILNRIPDFYMNKLVAGCVMLMTMSISLFLLTAEEADRLMGAMAIFAALVSYLFVASVYTPVLPYSTSLDQFLILCFVEVVAQACVHGVCFFYREREKLREEAALNEAQLKKEKQEQEQEHAEEEDDDEDEADEEDDIEPDAGQTNSTQPQQVDAPHAVDDADGPLPGSHYSVGLDGDLASPSQAAVISSKNQIAPTPSDSPPSHRPGSIQLQPLAPVYPSSMSMPMVVPVTMPLTPTFDERHQPIHRSITHTHMHPHAAHTAAAHRPTGTPPAAKKKKSNNKRDRKRARKLAAQQQQLALAAASNGGVLNVHITNSVNPVRIWYNSLGLTKIREIDLFFALFFSITFIVCTACIFGIPQTEQKS